MEPQDDFYQEHEQEYTYFHETEYYVNSPEGEAAWYDEPGGEIQGYIENGNTYTVSYTYTDENGVIWGQSRSSSSYNYSSYVEIDQLLSVYDSEFFADHSGEITRTKPEGLTGVGFSLDNLLDNEKTVLVWTYPHGAIKRATNYDDDNGVELINSCYYYYTDSDGRIWGYTGYYFTIKNVWFCLSDPNNETLAEPEIYTGEIYFKANEATDTSEKSMIYDVWPAQLLGTLAYGGIEGIIEKVLSFLISTVLIPVWLSTLAFIKLSHWNTQRKAIKNRNSEEYPDILYSKVCRIWLWFCCMKAYILAIAIAGRMAWEMAGKHGEISDVLGISFAIVIYIVIGTAYLVLLINKKVGGYYIILILDAFMIIVWFGVPRYEMVLINFVSLVITYGFINKYYFSRKCYPSEKQVVCRDSDASSG
ncbi:MAG: hypothetical protein LIO86_03200 [Lachnospiraceae bacterium]|nr:hypothetical protein [Lachnospiraceae bacterium]